ncbi:MAG: hypothetical protein ACFFDK_10055, partial [Promethearchaeota archaeon]
IINNIHVQSQLRTGELYFRATKDYCDCDTVLGSLNNLQEYQNLLNSQKVRTLKKKKWTDEEIDKWIKEKLQKEGSSTIGKKLTPMEREKEITRWLDFLNSILNNKKVSRIGLLKHWYDKDLQTEVITLARTEKIYIDKITPEFLLNLEEDVLYEFLPPHSF